MVAILPERDEDIIDYFTGDSLVMYIVNSKQLSHTGINSTYDKFYQMLWCYRDSVVRLVFQRLLVNSFVLFL